MLILKAILSSIWLFGIPKSPFDLVEIYPVTVLATAHYAMSQNWVSLNFVGLALLWDMTIGFWLMVSVISSAKRSLLRTLINLKDCSYHAVDLRDMLAPEQQKILERESLFEYLGRKGLPWNHVRDISIYRVEMGPSHTIPDSIGAFIIPFIGATLLLRDDPAESDTLERFSFWHEVGHTLGDEFVRRSVGVKGVKSPFFSLLLSSVAVQWNLQSAFVMAMSGLSLLILYRSFLHFMKSFRLVWEIRADRFAIELMSATDIEVLKSKLEQILPSDMPSDRDLNQFQSRERLKIFRDALKNYQSGYIGYDPSFVEFFVNSQLHSIILIGWMICLAMQFRPAGPDYVSWLLWSVSALAMITVIRYGISYWAGILTELIIRGSRCWKGGKFDFR